MVDLTNPPAEMVEAVVEDLVVADECARQEDRYYAMADAAIAAMAPFLEPVTIHPVERLFESEHMHYVSLFHTYQGFALLVSSYGLPTSTDPGMEDEEEWFHGQTIADVFRQAMEFLGIDAVVAATEGT